MLILHQHHPFLALTFTKAASKFQKNSKKQKAPKQAIKEATKKAKKEKVEKIIIANPFVLLINMKICDSLIQPTKKPSSTFRTKSLPGNLPKEKENGKPQNWIPTTKTKRMMPPQWTWTLG